MARRNKPRTWLPATFGQIDLDLWLGARNRAGTATAALREGSRGGAASFEQGDVAPAALVAADVVAGADDEESGVLVEAEAGVFSGKIPGLDGPDPGGGTVQLVA